MLVAGRFPNQQSNIPWLCCYFWSFTKLISSKPHPGWTLTFYLYEQWYEQDHTALTTCICKILTTYIVAPVKGEYNSFKNMFSGTLSIVN